MQIVFVPVDVLKLPHLLTHLSSFFSMFIILPITDWWYKSIKMFWRKLSDEKNTYNIWYLTKPKFNSFTILQNKYHIVTCIFFHIIFFSNIWMPVKNISKSVYSWCMVKHLIDSMVWCSTDNLKPVWHVSPDYIKLNVMWNIIFYYL
jgi:hypothetical protein